MGRLFRFVVSGSSVAELKDNMERALDELNGEQSTPREVPQDFLTEAAAQSGKSSNEKPAQFVTPPIPLQVPTPSHTASALATASPQGVDSMGLPWDERIHSSNMGKSKDGSWRARRGVEPAFVKQVEHELIARVKSGDITPERLQRLPEPIPPLTAAYSQVPAPNYPLPTPTLPPLQSVAPIVPLGNVPPPAPLTVQAPVAVPPMAVPIAPSIATPVAPPPVPQPVTSAHTLQTFIEKFIPTLAALADGGKLTPEYIAALKNYFKVEQIYQVNDAQKAEMFETFCKSGLLTKVG